MKNFKNKLYNLEATPPPMVWAAISDALDNDPEYILSQKLNQYQQLPSSTAWENIEATLDEKTQVPVIPFYQRHKKTLSYTGIAAAVLVILFATSLLFNQQRDSKKLVIQSVSGQQNMASEEQTDVSSKNRNYAIAYEPQSMASGYKKQHNIYKKAGHNNKNEVQAISTIQAPFSNNLDVVIKENDYDIDYSYLDRYVVYSNTTGDMVKLSKKVYSTFACAEFINEELCKQKIAYLQRKAALSSPTASADFAGVLEMITNFQE